MEKITAEELLDELGGMPLNEDKLTNVAGGQYDMNCYNDCYNSARQTNDGAALQTCLNECIK